MKKKTIGRVGISAFSLMMLFSVEAFAENVTLSSQKVSLNGNNVAVTPYNIDGSNYFKLRDIAMMLKDTNSKFKVDFFAEDRSVRISKSSDYTPVGDELKASEDKSNTCVKSDWSLYVDEKLVSCSVYNIGGSNYFKLRDLGDSIGFGVDFDAKTSTAKITAEEKPIEEKPTEEKPTEEKDKKDEATAEYKPDITFNLVDQSGKAWDESCFKDYDVTLINYWAAWCKPCCNELPYLQKLSEEYKDKNVLILGFMDGTEDDLAIIESLKLTYPSLIKGDTNIEQLNTGYLPSTILVNREGKIVGEALVGSRTYEQWAEVIKGAMPK